MLQLTPTTRIFVCTQQVDFRKGIDGLASLCRNQLGQDPFGGALFLFRNRSQNALRCLIYDGQGFWLCIKRLSKGKFRWWPSESTMDVREIQTLFWNGNPENAAFSTPWRKISMH